MEWIENANSLILPYFIVVLIVIFVLIAIGIALIAALYKRNREMKRKLELFMHGAKASSLEEAVTEVMETDKIILTENKKLEAEINELKENVLTAYRKTGIVKYNAFVGMAGKISSSVALLNNENNGLIINCMHSPDGCYTYVKEIMNGKSITPLTKEDEEALKKALQMQI